MLVKPKVVLQSFFVLLVGLGDLRAQVQEYNTKNPENAVQEGDHIVSVNGSSQDTEMVRQFRSAPFLLIVFRRTEAKVVEKRKLRLEDLRRRLGESLRISPAV